MTKIGVGRVHCEVEALEDWARFQRCLNIGLGDDCEMIQMEFNSVSASEAGDYFQVLFENQEDNLEGGYFLIQCQFEFPDEGEFYIESNDTRLCGPLEVKAATLSRQGLRLEMPSTKWKIIQVQFATDQAGYEELERVLGTMFEDRLQHARQDA